MNMKKIISWGMMLAAAFTLTNCAKEIDAPVQEPESVGYPFEIIASTVDTKTVNDGMSTNWATGDKINLFHAVGETTEYVNNNAFTLADVAEGRFTGDLAVALDPQEEYDWFAFYPYSSYITTPGQQTNGYTYIGSRSDTPQSQTGVDNMNHIAGEKYPLYGKAVAVGAGVKPKLTMYHASTLLQINVTNTLDEDLSIENISFTAPEGTSLVGTFYLDITGDDVAYADGQYVSNVANLSVADATIAPDATASFYLAVKPFTAVTGSELKIAVNGYEKTLTMSKDVTFTAGKIKTLKFGYDKEDAPAPEGSETITIDLTAQGYANAVEVSSVSKAPIEVKFNKGSNNNAPKYYASGTAVRIYGGGYFTVSTKVGTITAIEFTYGGDDGTNTITADCGTFSSPKWSGDASSVKFTIGGSTGNRRIKTIKVTYSTGGVIVEPTQLAAPVVNCTVVTSNSLTFSWSEVPNASGYEVTFNNGEPFEVNDTEYKVNGLNPETDYSISVMAVGDGTYYLNSIPGTCEGTTAPEQTSGGSPATSPCYVLDTSNNKGTNNGYAANCDVTVDGIKWNVTGNATMAPWRIGGKSLTKVDRNVYTKTPYDFPLSKIEFVTGSVGVTTWHSLKLVYSENSDFSNPQTITATEIGANKTITFAPEGGFPANCYYKFVMNITVTGTSNKYMQLKEIKFYGYE